MKTVVLIFALLLSFLLPHQAKKNLVVKQSIIETSFSFSVLSAKSATENLNPSCCEEEKNEFSPCHTDCKFFTALTSLSFISYFNHHESVETLWRLIDLMQITLRPPIIG